MSADFNIRIPESAIQELEEVESMDWSEGLRLPELILCINHVAERFRPGSIDGSARSGAGFTPRSFRRYQTLGCIDRPGRAGKSAVYGFRHYLQGVVVRRLLWERMSSGQIASLMAGKDVAELKRLLLEGAEIVAAGGGGEALQATGDAGTWKRIVLAPGVELHLESSRRRLGQEEAKRVLEGVGEAL